MASMVAGLAQDTALPRLLGPERDGAKRQRPPPEASAPFTCAASCSSLAVTSQEPPGRPHALHGPRLLGQRAPPSKGRGRDLADSPVCDPGCSAAPPQEHLQPQDTAPEPVRVHVELTARRLFDVNNVSQTFSITLQLVMKWEMPCDEEPPENDDGDWEPKWTPKYRVRLLMEDRGFEVMYSAVEQEGRMWVVMEACHRVSVYEQLELHSFPFDCQDLTVELESRLPRERVVWVPMHAAEQVVSLACPSRVMLDDFALVHECPLTWNLYVSRTHGSHRKSVSSLVVHFKVARVPWFYLINVMLVTLILCSFVLCAWAMHPADVEARFGVDFTLILTVQAFKMVLSSMLPKVSYMTLMDVYVLSGFLFLAAVTVSHTCLPHAFIDKVDISVLTQPPASYEGEEDLVRADNLSFQAFAGGWGVWNVTFFAYMCWHGRREYRRFVQKALDEQTAFNMSYLDVVDKQRTRHFVLPAVAKHRAC